MQKYLVNPLDGKRVKENKKEGLCEAKNDNQFFFFFFFSLDLQFYKDKISGETQKC